MKLIFIFVHNKTFQPKKRATQNGKTAGRDNQANGNLRESGSENEQKAEHFDADKNGTRKKSYWLLNMDENE